MKLTNILIGSAFILLASSSFSSCEKEDFSLLPAETQSGKNTFGCYVEGKRFFGGYLVHFGISPLHGEYHRQLDLLTIFADGKFQDKKQGSMAMEIFKPEVDVPLKMDRGEFDYYPRNFPGTNSVCTNFGLFEGGEVTITKFDTINKIVSGRFNMIGKCAIDINDFSGSDSINITEGRFDLKLTMYD